MVNELVLVCNGLFYFLWKSVKLGVRLVSVLGLFYDGMFIFFMFLWEFFVEFVECCIVCYVNGGC